MSVVDGGKRELELVGQTDELIEVDTEREVKISQSNDLRTR